MNPLIFKGFKKLYSKIKGCQSLSLNIKISTFIAKCNKYNYYVNIDDDKKLSMFLLSVHTIKVNIESLSPNSDFQTETKKICYNTKSQELIGYYLNEIIMVYEDTSSLKKHIYLFFKFFFILSYLITLDLLIDKLF